MGDSSHKIITQTNDEVKKSMPSDYKGLVRTLTL